MKEIWRPERVILPDDVLAATERGTLNNPEERSTGPLGRFTVVAVMYGGAPGSEYYVEKNTKIRGEDNPTFRKMKLFRDLHMRFLLGLSQTVDWSRVDSFRVALNGVSQDVIYTLQQLAQDRKVIAYGPNENRLKYPRLREIFTTHQHDPIPVGQFVAYFDDDVEFIYPDWVRRLDDAVEKGLAQMKPARMFGEHYRINLPEGSRRWHESRYWWKGRRPITRGRGMQVDFITGGAWCMNIDDLRELDWPDPALTHNGGDVALGSAMFQRQWPFRNVRYVDQHNTGRRGTSHPQPFLR